MLVRIVFIVLAVPILIQIGLWYRIQTAYDRLVPASVADCEEFDFIVVGAGSAGSALTGRLLEAGNFKILLIEAGGWPHYLQQFPGMDGLFVQWTNDYCWHHETTPQKVGFEGDPNRTLKTVTGKALGGGSQLNFMIYNRGNSKDYDEWEDLGNPGWGYNKVLKYFKKAEKFHNPNGASDPIDSNYHGVEGHLWVMPAGDEAGFTNVAIEAGKEMGFKHGDYNGKHQNEQIMSRVQVTQKEGFRSDSFFSYILEPGLLHSPNFKLLTNAQVTKLIFDEKDPFVVKGVEVLKFGITSKYFAKNEVVLSSGAVGSPKIMMLSGLGLREQLEELGIKVRKDIPGVGSNLQDHVVAYFEIMKTTGYASLSNSPWKMINPSEYARYFMTGQGGPLGDNGAQATANFDSGIKANDKYNRRDMQMHICSWAMDVDYRTESRDMRGITEYIYNNLLLAEGDHEQTLLVPTLLRPKSRGTVRLKSTDPNDLPIIDPNYLSNPEDLEKMVRGMKVAKAFTDTKAFKEHGFVHVCDIPNCQVYLVFSDDYYKCLIKHLTGHFYHWSSTNKMGPASDSMAVVDHTLKVHGVKRLRIVDASIMPTIVGGNTNAPTIMIAEKAADMILDSWLIPAKGHSNRPKKDDL